MEENTLVFIVMLIIIVVVISIVQGWGQNQNVIDEHELFKKQFESEYGSPSLEIRNTWRPNTKDTILVFSNSEKIVINECVHAFSDIIDFSVNEKKSYKSSTSTGSIIGRGIVGGVLLGGVGALAGATTAKKNTIEKVDGYTIRITMRGFDKPDIKIHTMFEDYMEEVTSVLKKVIDYNEKKYNI